MSNKCWYIHNNMYMYIILYIYTQIISDPRMQCMVVFQYQYIMVYQYYNGIIYIAIVVRIGGLNFMDDSDSDKVSLTSLVVCSG